MSRTFEISMCEFLKNLLYWKERVSCHCKAEDVTCSEDKNSTVLQPKMLWFTALHLKFDVFICWSGRIGKLKCYSPHQTICGQGSSSHTHHTYMCIFRVSSLFLPFWSTLSIWSYIYVVYIQYVLLPITQNHVKNACNYYDT